jgi:hypothetical protein
MTIAPAISRNISITIAITITMITASAIIFLRITIAMIAASAVIFLLLVFWRWLPVVGLTEQEIHGGFKRVVVYSKSVVGLAKNKGGAMGRERRGGGKS